MATFLSVNALQASVAQAERQVQQGQTRVAQDAARLDASRNQLAQERQRLSDTERESNQASAAQQASTPSINLDRAIEKPSRPAQQLPASRPQVNTLGQALGKFINVTA
ncbi:hypothetical protein [Duganella callida]|uniref:Uncharacterized protein n=1 Tax=Duganella callida TaxID=2561932 RepID=A0A4Y9SFM2_9BURK|nr:hypothetical protein [Duganella callida]TFW22278.1 hypothetical protein E4L98_12365 [Duganella callida]